MCFTVEANRDIARVWLVKVDDLGAEVINLLKIWARRFLLLKSLSGWNQLMLTTIHLLNLKIVHLVSKVSEPPLRMIYVYP